MSKDVQPERLGLLHVTWLSTPDADEGTLARLVAGLTDVAPADVRIVRACRSCGSDRHGKPQVVLPATAPPVHVSLSRSGGTTMVAISETGPVGVDLEVVLPDSPDLTSWVRIESLVKATGHGLTVDPTEIEVTAPGTPPAVLRWPSTEPLEAPVWMFDVTGPAGYVAAATVLSAVAPRLVTRPAAPGA